MIHYTMGVFQHLDSARPGMCTIVYHETLQILLLKGESNLS